MISSQQGGAPAARLAHNQKVASSILAPASHFSLHDLLDLGRLAQAWRHFFAL